jgi:hypothetical protein
MASRSWALMREYMSMYFNNIYNEYDGNYKSLGRNILKLKNMVKRIKESKNKYLNDEEIIAKKEKSIRTMVEKRSRNKGLRDRLKKYQMGEWELNALVYYMNKQIVNEMLLAKTWYIPFRMGHIKPTYINFGKHSLVVNWPKSIENHLNIIKKEAPLLYHAYKVEKRITKKEYFKLARPYVSPRKPHNLWLEYFEGQSWAYFRWYSNYKFINKYENYYRLYFTAYNRVPEVAKEVVDYRTINTLSYLNSPEKIINSNELGTQTKLMYLQIQDPDYKLKYIDQ